MPEPVEILFLVRCQKGLLWAGEDVDLPPYPVVGLVSTGQTTGNSFRVKLEEVL